MCNANAKIIALVTERQEYKRIKEEAEARVKELDAQIEKFMEENEASKMTAGTFKVIYINTTQPRLDTKALVEMLGKDALQPYYKSVPFKQLRIS